MLICLEGVDGAGKSTLAAYLKEAIAKKHPNDTVEIIHSSQLKTDVYSAYVTPLDSYGPGSGKHLILDRWHVGENVYGPLYRKKSAFDSYSFNWVDLYMASLGARLWNVTQTLEVLHKRLRFRGEDYLRDDHVDFVRKEFKVQSQKSAIFANSISPTEYDIDDFVEAIIDDAEYAENRAAAVLSFDVNYLGITFTDPKHVLIMDNKAKNKNFDPRNSSEAVDFFTRLPENMRNDFAVISSISLERLENILTWYEYFSVVAYGPTVSARLKVMGIPHEMINPADDSRQYTIDISRTAEKAGKLP